MQLRIDRQCLQGSKSGAAVKTIVGSSPQELASNFAQVVVPDEQRNTPAFSRG